MCFFMLILNEILLSSFPGVVYLDVEMQKKLGLRILQYIPTKSYARKNIGYLFAIKVCTKCFFYFISPCLLETYYKFYKT